jgi:hypothetical protein
VQKHESRVIAVPHAWSQTFDPTSSANWLSGHHRAAARLRTRSCGSTAVKSSRAHARSSRSTASFWTVEELDPGKERGYQLDLSKVRDLLSRYLLILTSRRQRLLAGSPGRASVLADEIGGFDFAVLVD